MSRANPRFRRINPQLPSLSSATAFRIQPMGTIDGQMWITSFDYIWAGGTIPNANAESNLSTNWILNVAASFKGVMAADVAWTQVKVSCLTIPNRLPFINNSAGGLGNGTVAGNHLNSELAAIITKYTHFKGQHGRGRNYMPGVPTSFVNPAVDANRLTAAAGALYNVFIGNVVVNISDGTNNYSLGVTQRTRGGAAATNGDTQELVVLHLLLGTVRRRRIGRGK